MTHFATLAQLIYCSLTSPIFSLSRLGRPIQPDQGNEPGLEVNRAVKELQDLMSVLAEVS